MAREAGIDNRHSRRFARVDLDFDALLHAAEPPREGVEPTEFAALAQSTATIEPFPGEVYQLNGRYVEEWTDSSWSWVGAIEGYEYADFVVSSTETGYFGMMRVGPIVYEILQGLDDQTYVREIDVAAYEIESACAHGINAHDVEKTLYEFDADVDSKTPIGAAPASKSSGGTAVIDILLLFSPAAETNYDIEALANSSIASLNTSFGDSGVDAVARIVHYDEVAGYVESSPMNIPEIQQVTIDMSDGVDDFSHVPTLRDTHDADLAMFLWDESEMGTTCGSAWMPTSPSGDDDDFTANTGDACISAFNNFAHEIGHNLGTNHDYPDSGAYSYSNGYSFAGGGGTPEFRTIMGSNHNCSTAGCDRLNVWSDPDETYFSQPIGVANQSDAVRSLDAMTGVIAGYRTPSGSSPSSFGSVSVIRGLCFGANWVGYSAPTGLIGWYEIQTDSSNSFPSPDNFYRGVRTSVPLEVSSTTYVRARACNSVGCNSWENGSQSATYTAGCL